MTAKKPDVSPDGRYELRDAALVLGVSKVTVLRWTNSGLLKAGTRSANGRKVWLGSELIRIWRAMQ